MSYAGNAKTPGWVKALDFDWTAQGTGTISSDGNVTIGGVVWKKANSTNDASAMAYSSSGLVIQPKSTSDYGSTRTLPLLWTKLQSIIPTLELSFGVRVWAYWSADNFNANYDGEVIAVDNDGTSGAIFARGRNAGGSNGFSDWINNAGANPLGFQNTNVTLDSTNRVQMLEVPSLALPMCKTYYGAWSSGWPAVTSLTPISGSIAPRGMNMTLANAGVTTGAQRSGSGTSLSVTLSRLRIDYIVR
jgi:hypothetical protein